MTTLSDASVREQAIGGTDRSMALSAGAGSGKTTVLVRRLINVLRRGTPPRAVAAITFTVKAAGELVERVRDELEDALRGASGDERAQLQRILEALPELTISTIHSFCGELLRHEALEAGWAPRTEVLGEVYAPSAVATAYRAWRRGFDGRHPEAALELLRDVEVAEKTLQKAVMTVLEHRDLGPVLGRAEPPWADAVAQLQPIRRAILDAADGCRAPGTCKLFGKNEVLIAGVRSLDLTAAPAEVCRQAAALPHGNLQGGRGADWPDDGKARFGDGVKALREWSEAARTMAYEPLHRLVIGDVVAEFLPAVAAAKVEAAQVDFQDLLFQTEALLRERPQAAARLSRRFAAILVDEVQDTDPIQSAIVARLARTPGLDGRWDLHPPRPGALFAVGDPQQSIYRFRRADVALWRRLHGLIGGDDAGQASLSQNFRSVPGVVAFVNEAFRDYPGYRRLAAHRARAALEPVVMLVDDASGGDASGGDAEAVALYLKALVEAGAQVTDRESGQLRPARWSDVMVLLPAWTKADAVQAALLARGIPSVVEGGRTFFGRDEIRLCLAVLRAVEEPADGEAVVMVLRGLFGVSMSELAAHRSAGGSWRYTVPDQPPGPARDALEVLAGCYRRRGKASWVTLLDAVLEETGAPAVWSLLPRGPAMLANVDKLRAVVRELEGHVRSGYELLERLDALQREDDEDLPLAGADADVVRITSYFKAKGLEAPIVVLPYANRGASGVTHVVDRDDDALRVKIGPLLPPGWATAEAMEKAAQEEERRRWMYVAATRAREQLVIVTGAKCGLLDADLRHALPGPECADGERVATAPGVTVRVARATGLPAADVDQSTFPGRDEAVDQLLAAPGALADPGPAWRRRRRRAVEASKRASLTWRSVTELSARGRGAAGGRVSRQDTRAGSVIHAVMERLDLMRPASALTAEAERLALRLGADADLDADHIESCRQIAQRLLTHEVLARARRAPEHWKEVPFAYPAEGGVVSGTIDLAFPTDASRRRWVVVDWKSVSPPEGSPNRARYETQLAYYARAIIETITGVAPEDVETVLAGPPPELASDPWEDALAEADEAVHSVLSALSAAGADAPEVGADVGSPVIASNVELAWPARRVALALEHDPAELDAMRKAGWSVFDAADGGALTALAAALEVDLAAEIHAEA
ncbi:MAG: hypothetical protein CVU56_15615 [Deltaproteobacteria bacterium HGW-Deltaproteobacteria-14]|jgi:ATP-dependent exoDNAse (exonuclease V) beta subunit|nr:MAG: hypothetical protein CVU56_15615 [Deltaproteobacteria bacterium HGW-Deltaproteobacteria-14]